MKALTGICAILTALQHSPAAALQRAGPDEVTRHLPSGIIVAQTRSSELPAARVSGVAGNPIPLSLKPPTSDILFIKISDFPDELQLSRGFRLKGSWITSVNDLENLELIAPSGLVKTIRLDVLYFQNNQSPAVAQRVLTVDLQPADRIVRNVPKQDSRAVSAAPGNQPEAGQSEAELRATTMSAEQEIESLERGAILMRNGDIAAARLLYEDLAVNGSAKGARALAETYDPVYLKGVFIAGLRPNPEKAKIWYGRAAELGDTVSITRLSALDRR